MVLICISLIIKATEHIVDVLKVLLPLQNIYLIFSSFFGFQSYWFVAVYYTLQIFLLWLLHGWQIFFCHILVCVFHLITMAFERWENLNFTIIKFSIFSYIVCAFYDLLKKFFIVLMSYSLYWLQNFDLLLFTLKPLFYLELIFL